MESPSDLSPAELERFGLGKIQRALQPDATLLRLYCLRCGSQVAADRRDVDPARWWICVRGCNTRYATQIPQPSRRDTL